MAFTMVTWLFGDKDAPQLSVGSMDADIPILPPFMALGLAALAFVVSRMVPIAILPDNKLMKVTPPRLVLWRMAYTANINTLYTLLTLVPISISSPCLSDFQWQWRLWR